MRPVRVINGSPPVEMSLGEAGGRTIVADPNSYRSYEISLLGPP